MLESTGKKSLGEYLELEFVLRRCVCGSDCPHNSHRIFFIIFFNFIDMCVHFMSALVKVLACHQAEAPFINMDWLYSSMDK